MKEGYYAMKNDYYDILARAGTPQWYDQDGVPRYQSFSPHLCGPYATAVAYLEVRCQNCNALFWVAKTNARGGMTLDPMPGPRAMPGLWAYGDPPAHDYPGSDHRCMGTTMNSLPLRVLEFWRVDNYGWSRDQGEEGALPDADLPEQYKTKAHDLCGDPDCTNPAHLKARDE